MTHLIDAMLYPIDVEDQSLAMALNLNRLASAWREVELMDAHHLILTGNAAVDHQLGHVSQQLPRCAFSA